MVVGEEGPGVEVRAGVLVPTRVGWVLTGAGTSSPSPVVEAFTRGLDESPQAASSSMEKSIAAPGTSLDARPGFLVATLVPLLFVAGRGSNREVYYWPC